MEHYYQSIGENWFSYPNLYSSAVKEANEGSHFVEVGSWRGRSAAYMAVEIVNSQKKIHFDCVDTFDGSEEHLDPNSIWYVPELVEDKDYIFKEFHKNIEPVRMVVNAHRTTSLEGSKKYENESLDFVFIDAAHDYENVLLDIQNWFPKVKKGGVIAGHDITYHEVQRAVSEYSLENGIEIQVNFDEDIWFYKK